MTYYNTAILVLLLVASTSGFATIDDEVIDAWSKETIETQNANEEEHESLSVEIPDKWKNDLPKNSVIYWVNNGTGERVNDSRVSVDPEGTLHFAFLLGNDTGDYHAIVNFTTSNRTLKVCNLNLNVAENDSTYKKPTIIYNSLQTQTLIAGETLELWCIPAGYPLPVVTWSRADGDSIADSRSGIWNWNRTLRIDNLEASDAGDYICEVPSLQQEEGGSSLSMRFTVMVEDRSSGTKDNQGGGDDISHVVPLPDSKDIIQPKIEIPAPTERSEGKDTVRNDTVPTNQDDNGGKLEILPKISNSSNETHELSPGVGDSMTINTTLTQTTASVDKEVSRNSGLRSIGMKESCRKTVWALLIITLVIVCVG